MRHGLHRMGEIPPTSAGFLAYHEYSPLISIRTKPLAFFRFSTYGTGTGLFPSLHSGLNARLVRPLSRLEGGAGLWPSAGTPNALLRAR